jgi:hypothetical protein
LLTSRGIAVAHGMRDKNLNPWPVQTRPIETFDGMQARLFADAEFCSLLDFRYMHMNHTLDEYEDLLRAINNILGLIRRSIDETSV